MELIKSRFYKQSLSENYIPRRRLVELLNVRNHKGLTLISAPAGFGKTELLVEWTEQSLCRTAWLSLTQQESDLYQFARYLIGCLHVGLNLSLDKSSNLCTKSLKENFDLFFTTFINELEDYEQPFNLILDDFHLADSADVDHFINLLIEHLPSTVRLVLVTREDPKLQLGKLRISTSYREVRAVQLRFTYDEIACFFSQNVEGEIEDKLLSRIEEKTEGWIASMQLMALSLVGSKNISQDIYDFSGSNRFIIEYLVESVLQTLSQQHVDFLIKTTAFERFTPQLCDYALGTEGSADIIARFVANNLFLVPLDNKGEWFRYHHLFSEILTALDHSNIENGSEIHSRTAEWFESHGYFREAIEHAFKAGDEMATLSLINQHWPVLSFSETDELLISWMNNINGDYLTKFPYLYALFGLNLLSIDLAKGQVYLERVQQLGENESNNSEAQTYLALVGLGNAYISAARGQFEQIIPSAEKALQALSNAEQLNDSEIVWVGSAYALISTASWMNGDMKATIKSLKKAIGYMQTSNNTGAVWSTNYMLLQAYLDQGDIKKAQFYNSTMLEAVQSTIQQTAQNADKSSPQGGAEIFLTKALVDYETGELAKASEHLRYAMNLGVKSQLREAAHKYPILQAKLNYFSDSKDQVQEQLTRSEAIRIANPIPDTYSAEYWRARFALLDQDDAYLSVWSEDKGFSFDYQLTVVDEPSYVIWLHWLAVKGTLYQTSRRQLMSVLEPLILETKQQGRYRTYIEVVLIRALLQLNSGAKCDVTSIAGAMVMAQELGLKQTLKQFPALKSLLNQESITEQFTRPLLQYVRGTILGEEALRELNLQQAKKLMLSGKEIAVLKHLASDKTGPEICKALYVSLNTFRTHSKNIYSKLDVNSRMAAVKKATEMQILQ
ncbi:LuxR C-terminal-related transcriptional regulator [Psychrosphaera sp. B3R10]|uniref:LuxR C-terminal-related transcriptional regulator n=1 Tax=unclassified Psychrosphaera TaxID=2641570 RepID=UPI001C0A431D|nr:MULTISPECIES: LuxR C-terminal-related transcriptional regulator [unclassified Psychrosphaera]MBU2881873.1 LuxR C-terminal-related transcriptional regulator [Psychrosphaera sp. I2R16]MBU2989894.1 LuxR C-terminal-related transcriptional regulator [Psychrosphaera sp. B3R10]